MNDREIQYMRNPASKIISNKMEVVCRVRWVSPDDFTNGGVWAKSPSMEPLFISFEELKADWTLSL